VVALSWAATQGHPYKSNRNVQYTNFLWFDLDSGLKDPGLSSLRLWTPD